MEFAIDVPEANRAARRAHRRSDVCVVAAPRQSALRATAIRDGNARPNYKQ
jgi:hypothetical protein